MVGIVAEESDPTSFAGYASASAVWFVDPLDGTREFVARNGEFAVMIGLAEEGRATAGVIVFGLSWLLGLALFAVWLTMALLSRISSVAAVTGAMALVPLGFYLLGNGPQAWALVPIALLLIWRHRGNLKKLLAGEETKIGEQKTD